MMNDRNFSAKTGSRPGLVGERPQSGDLALLAGRVRGRQVPLGLEQTDLLGALEALGEQVHEGGVDVVDAAAQARELGRDLVTAPGRVAHPVRVGGSPLDEGVDSVPRTAALRHDLGDAAGTSCRRRHLGEQLVEAVHRLGRTLGDDLDAAVDRVAGVADEAELEGARPRPPPEAHPLHVSRARRKCPAPGRARPVSLASMAHHRMPAWPGWERDAPRASVTAVPPVTMLTSSTPGLHGPPVRRHSPAPEEGAA